MEFCKVTLTFESVDESSPPALLHGAISSSKFYKIKFGNLVEICFCLNLAVKVLKLTCPKQGSRQVMLQLNQYQRQGSQVTKGKQNDRAACPKEVLEFQFFSEH